jgi:hypothetical protein
MTAPQRPGTQPGERVDDLGFQGLVASWIWNGTSWQPFQTASDRSPVTSAGLLAPVAQALVELEAERDRYRTALKSIALGHKQCGCNEAWQIAHDALRPDESPDTPSTT